MFDILSPLRSIRRFRDVQLVLLRYGFGFLLSNQEIRALRRTLRRTLGWGYSIEETEYEERAAPARMRMMLQELGPTYIKIGQLLASRGDMLPEEWIAELAKLQDDVPPFGYEQAREVIEGEFGKPIGDIFWEFEQQPFAAASIGQVHRARLLDMTPVVVKVRRPNVVEQVRSDIEIIRAIVKLVEGRIAWGKRYGLVAVFEEFARALTLELDYRIEASNADRLRKQTMLEPKVHIPRIYWELTTDKVLTMEAIEGIKINDLEALDAAGIDRAEMARVFIQCLFKQILIDGFFHSDPHPGNVIVELGKQRLVILDTGQMGRLMPEQLVQLGDLVQSVLRRDSRDVMRIFLEIGTPFKKVDEPAFRRSLDFIINRYLDASLDRIKFSNMFAEMLGSIYKHGVRLPSELTLAIKAIIQAEEIARTLDPSIQIVEVVEGIYRQIIQKMLDPRSMFDSVRDGVREARRLRGVLPRALESILRQLESGSLTVAIQIPEFISIVASLMIIANRLVTGLIIVGMMIGSALLMNITVVKGWGFLKYIGMFAFILAMLSGFILIWDVLLDIWENQRRKKGPFY